VAAKAIADQYSSSAGTSFFAPHFGTLSRRLPVPASLRTEVREEGARPREGSHTQRMREMFCGWANARPRPSRSTSLRRTSLWC
jgi:hypothetical protein